MSKYFVKKSGYERKFDEIVTFRLNDQEKSDINQVVLYAIDPVFGRKYLSFSHFVRVSVIINLKNELRKLKKNEG